MYIIDLIMFICIIWGVVLIANPGIGVKKDKLPKGKTYDEKLKENRTLGIVAVVIGILTLLFF